MYIDFFNNLATMVALLFIAGKFYEKRPLDLNSPFSTRFYAGLGSGILGTLLLVNTISVTEEVILDLRHLAVVIAAFFGGPISAIVASFIIGFARAVMYGVSLTSLIVGYVIFAMGFVLGFIAVLPVRRLMKYILMNVVYIAVNAILIGIFIEDDALIQISLVNHTILSVVGGVITYYMTDYIQKSNQSQRSVHYYKLIAENSTDVVSTHTKEGVIEYISRSSKSTLGYDPDELLGLNVFDFIHPNDTKPPLVLHKTPKRTLEFRFRHKNGHYVWLETTSDKMKGFDQKVHYIYTSREITERKQMELEMSSMTNELERLSNLDGLTEIPNRRRLDFTLDKEWKRAQHEQTPLSFILFDLDQFKAYNDTYGHVQGDACLKEIARSVKPIMREQDLFARYGGEEFGVLLPDTNAEVAKELAELMRKIVSNQRIPHQNSSVLPFITISGGVSTIIPSKNADQTSLIDQADQALYEAKENGRNRICLFSTIIKEDAK